MENKNLITIGKLSKITGVHVKALRYYDRIGILPPTYINEENGYRYYSHLHVYLVEAIRLCTELNIPLKQLKNFLSEDGSQIQWLNLIRFGRTMAQSRIAKLNETLNILNDFEKEIERTEQFQNKLAPHRIEMPPKNYWIVPYDGVLGNTIYHTRLAEAYDEVIALDLEPTFESGLISFVRDSFETFIFIEINETSPIESNRFLQLPATTYLTHVTQNNDI